MQGKSLYQMRRDEVLPKSLEETDGRQIVHTASCPEMDRVSITGKRRNPFAGMRRL
ncbi:MAG: hypothetical protein K9L24_00690 [Spirochaetia bacterium]|nr:hypothetical protein [Spirochaetia bacterium]